MDKNEKFENLEFYGKKVKDMNEKETNLLIVDLLMLATMTLMERNETSKFDVMGIEFELGTPKTYFILSNTRGDLVSNILGLDGQPDIVRLVMSEMTEYSFRDFLINIKEKIKNGEFDMNDTFVHMSNFDVNFSLN